MKGKDRCDMGKRRERKGSRWRNGMELRKRDSEKLPPVLLCCFVCWIDRVDSIVLVNLSIISIHLPILSRRGSKSDVDPKTSQLWIEAYRQRKPRITPSHWEIHHHKTHLGRKSSEKNKDYIDAIEIFPFDSDKREREQFTIRLFDFALLSILRTL